MSDFNVGFVIFPDLTQLDFTGPLQVLARLPQSAIHIIAKSAAPVASDCGLGLVSTSTFANCPPLDLICAIRFRPSRSSPGRYHISFVPSLRGYQTDASRWDRASGRGMSRGRGD